MRNLDEEGRNMFRPLTQKSSVTSEEEQPSKYKGLDAENKEPSSEDGRSKPDESLRQKSLLPPWLDVYLPRELVNTPLEDIDSFYEGRKTFVVITKGRRIFRFDATNAFRILGPLNPIRRLAISTFTHPLFLLLMVAVILATCFFMIVPRTPTIVAILYAFTAVYTIEVIVKVMARGFVLRPFTYLRDPWNCLDFVLTVLAHTPIGPDIGGFAVLRGLRLLEALEFTKHAPAMKVILATVKKSGKNLASVLVLVAFFVFVFALSGLLHFMGILTQKCVANFSTGGSLTDENWTNFVSNSTNWYYPMAACGNSSGSGPCIEGYTCLQGYGTNPNYGFTNFDTFGWASLSAFQLLTQDYWENLYQLVLRTAGPWHVLYFILAVFFASNYLQALILAVVVRTYNEELWRMEEGEAEECAMSEYVAEMRERMKKSEENPSNGQSSAKAFSAAQGRLPYADDSDPITPVTEEDLSKMNDTFDDAVQTEKATLRSKVINFLCVWDCCSPWEKFRQIVSLVVFDPFAVIFSALCIIVDAALMALHHHGMSDDVKITLENANYFFTIAFAVEVVMKIVALHPKHYFQKKWNVFEFVVITLSVLELGFGHAMTLSVLRAFRLLRLIKSSRLRIFRTLSSLLFIVEKSLTPIMYQTFAFAIITTVFATLGMHLFGRYYIDNIDRFPDSDLPRWNFTDYLHSYMLLFRALCGEWIETMWDCMLVNDVTCIPFFLCVVLFGRFVMRNLLLAPILINVGSSSWHTYPKDGDSKTKQALERISRALKWLKSKQTKLTDQVSTQIADDEQGNNEQNLKLRSWESHLNEAGLSETEEVKSCGGGGTSESFFEMKVADENEKLSKKGSRFGIERLVENKYFEIAVGGIIVMSSLALALDDIYLQNRLLLQQILYNLHAIVTVAFVVEMLMRWFGLGSRKFFTSPMCLLDFFVVVCCSTHLIALLCAQQEIRVLKSVRILRLLRVIRKKKGMNVVVNTLIKGVPSACSALFLAFVIWLTFALLGVRLFAGKYFKCLDANEAKIAYEIIPDFDACVAENYTWKNSDVNFDHLGNAYLSLLQVATFKGWIQIMNDAVDSRELNRQPIRETNIYMFLYFNVFVLIGSFFALALFIGVVILSYNEQMAKARRKRNLELFMTADDLAAYTAMKKISSWKPVKAIRRPKWKLQAGIYETVRSKEFEIIFMLFIGLNMLALAMDHYQLNESFAMVLDYVSLIFWGVFAVECVLKMIAFRLHYFKDPWNLFDLTIVLLSVLSLATPKYTFSVATLSLFRIIRVVKIGRLLRQIKCAEHIRNFLSLTSRCLPAIFNIVLLLFVVILIFAAFGMTFFMRVKEKGALDDVFNFRTFGSSVIVLIQVSTLAGWDGVLEAIANEEDCRAEACGSYTLGIAFMLSYLFVTYLIGLMYIPVVFWHYSKMEEEAKEGISDDDCAMFVETWQQFDPDATNYIQYDQLSDFLDALEPPLRIRKPNKFKIVAQDIPICKSDRLFFVDVFSAVVADIFNRTGRLFNTEIFQEQMQPVNPDYQVVSSTLSRQREAHSARVIQKSWKKHKDFGTSSNDGKPKAFHSSVEVETNGDATKNGHTTKLCSRTPTFNSHSHIADL